MAIGTTNFQENVLVKLTTETGETGWGEAPHMVGHSQKGETPATVRVLLRDKLVPAVLGLDPLNIAQLALAMDRAVPANLRAKGAVVMAAYDLMGHATGQPVSALLGGRVRETIPLSWSLPITDERSLLDEAAATLERGWRILKVKAGRPDPRDDAHVVRSLRKSVGDEISIRVDANQAYGVKSAIRAAAEFAEAGVEFFEQPVHRYDVAALAEVRAHSAIPIMCDESAQTPEELLAVIRARAIDCASIYVIGAGGLQRSKQMADLVEAANLRGYVGGALESGLGASAGVHLAAASPAIDLGCEMSGQFLLEDALTTEPLELRDGELVVPNGPGLGVNVDEERIAALRVGEPEMFTHRDARPTVPV